MMEVKILPLVLLLSSTFFVSATRSSSSSYDTIPGRPCLRSMSGMIDSMRDLASSRPDLVTISTIGESYLRIHEGRQIPDTGRVDPEGRVRHLRREGRQRRQRSRRRWQCVARRRSRSRLHEEGEDANNERRPRAGAAPPELVARFVETLMAGYDVDADITSILDRTEVHAILYVNPDGRHVAERRPDLQPPVEEEPQPRQLRRRRQGVRRRTTSSPTGWTSIATSTSRGGTRAGRRTIPAWTTTTASRPCRSRRRGRSPGTPADPFFSVAPAAAASLFSGYIMRTILWAEGQLFAPLRLLLVGWKST